MYLIIKKDKAEHLSHKLHEVKAIVAEVMDCIEEAKEREYEHDGYHRDYARHEGHYAEPYEKHHEHERFEDEIYEHDYARRGRRGRGRY